VPDYLVSFSAVSSDPLRSDAAERLAAALGATPGAGPVDGASQESDARRVTATFVIDMPRGQGMADAARDGSRLAKEALNSAGMPAAQLVHLAIRLADESDGEDADPG
jgi:hypothetical protein